MPRARAILITLLAVATSLTLGTAAVAWVGGMLSGGMVAVMTWLLGQLVLPVSGGLGLLGAIGLALLSPRRRWLALGLALLALVELVPALQLLGLWAPRYPSTIEGSEPHATVRLPLDGPVIVGWGGDTVATNYHAAHPDQRWAYDLLVEPAGLGTPELEDYGCYGLPVLAPAAGTVVVKQTGHPDQDPSEFVPNLQAPAGNYVGIELEETGTHIVLAHFQPGSIEVRLGDRVEEGQVLGRCGNSGNTSEPHVHLHHQRQKPDMIGIAEGLPLFFRGHDGAAMPEGGIEVEGETVTLVGDRVRHGGG